MAVVELSELINHRLRDQYLNSYLAFVRSFSMLPDRNPAAPGFDEAEFLDKTIGIPFLRKFFGDIGTKIAQIPAVFVDGLVFAGVEEIMINLISDHMTGKGIKIIDGDAIVHKDDERTKAELLSAQGAVDSMRKNFVRHAALQSSEKDRIKRMTLAYCIVGNRASEEDLLAVNLKKHIRDSADPTEQALKLGELYLISVSEVCDIAPAKSTPGYSLAREIMDEAKELFEYGAATAISKSDPKIKGPEEILSNYTGRAALSDFCKELLATVSRVRRIENRIRQLD